MTAEYNEKPKLSFILINSSMLCGNILLLWPWPTNCCNSVNYQNTNKFKCRCVGCSLF